ncbi:MAG: hypothetical protein IJD97_10060 [Clostridia bacterium]|nr:hypothetical protein [Clostridia bacterium]
MNPSQNALKNTIIHIYQREKDNLVNLYRSSDFVKIEKATLLELSRNIILNSKKDITKVLRDQFKIENIETIWREIAEEILDVNYVFSEKISIKTAYITNRDNLKNWCDNLYSSVVKTINKRQIRTESNKEN